MAEEKEKEIRRAAVDQTAVVSRDSRPEIRNPKSEIRKKAEIRNPK